MARIHERTIFIKGLNDPNSHNGVINHLETEDLECEVKWALGSIMMQTATGGDGIPADLFQMGEHSSTHQQKSGLKIC